MSVFGYGSSYVPQQPQLGQQQGMAGPAQPSPFGKPKRSLPVTGDPYNDQVFNPTGPQSVTPLGFDPQSIKGQWGLNVNFAPDPTKKGMESYKQTVSGMPSGRKTNFGTDKKVTVSDKRDPYSDFMKRIAQVQHAPTTPGGMTERDIDTQIQKRARLWQEQRRNGQQFDYSNPTSGNIELANQMEEWRKEYQPFRAQSPYEYMKTLTRDLDARELSQLGGPQNIRNMYSNLAQNLTNAYDVYGANYGGRSLQDSLDYLQDAYERNLSVMNEARML